MALTKVTGQVIKNTTDVTVGVLTVTNTLAVGGTVSIGGTLTYEDVTNVDAVGLITARNGIVVGSGITLSKDGDIFATGIVTATTFSGNFSGDGSSLTGIAGTENIRTNTNATFLQNINVSGTVTATSYAGSGANLTNLPAANITGTLPAISGANLTNLDASDLASGTIPDARFPATLPAVSGANLTGLAAGGAFIKGVVGVTTLTPVGIETSTVTRKDLIGPCLLYTSPSPRDNR